ncbi:hypothetical protein KAW43_03370 [Candidatus Parcubacteria bacterium]|nr:hypothetical protein [Candidatus Parcubacteria bacterium]
MVEKGESKFLAINTARGIKEQQGISEEEIKGQQKSAREFIHELKVEKEEMLLPSAAAADFYFADRPEILQVDKDGRVLLVRKGNPVVEVRPDIDFKLLLELADTETTDIQTNNQ